MGVIVDLACPILELSFIFTLAQLLHWMPLLVATPCILLDFGPAQGGH